MSEFKGGESNLKQRAVLDTILPTRIVKSSSPRIRKTARDSSNMFSKDVMYKDQRPTDQAQLSKLRDHVTKGLL